MNLIIAIIMFILAILVWMTLRAVWTLDNCLLHEIYQIEHDLQQIKVRLHWSREREIAHKPRNSSRSSAGYKKITYKTK